MSLRFCAPDSSDDSDDYYFCRAEELYQNVRGGATESWVYRILEGRNADTDVWWAYHFFEEICSDRGEDFVELHELYFSEEFFAFRNSIHSREYRLIGGSGRRLLRMPPHFMDRMMPALLNSHFFKTDEQLRETARKVGRLRKMLG